MDGVTVVKLNELELNIIHNLLDNSEHKAHDPHVSSLEKDFKRIIEDYKEVKGEDLKDRAEGRLGPLCYDCD